MYKYIETCYKSFNLKVNYLIDNCLYTAKKDWHLLCHVKIFVMTLLYHTCHAHNTKKHLTVNNTKTATHIGF